MDQEQLSEAVDEGDAYQIFFADAADGQPSLEVVRKKKQDHGESVRKVWHDKIRQECVGLPAGALDAWDSQAEHLRLSIREGDKVTLIASSGAAGTFRATERADYKEQRVLFETLSE